MVRPRSLASNAANLVFGPPILAYGLIVVHEVAYGIGLYVAAMSIAYKLQFLSRFRDWPTVSQITVFAGTLLLVLAVCLRIYGILAYWVLLPCAGYALLTMVAGLALRRLR